MLTGVLGMGKNGDGELGKQKPFHEFLGMVGSDSRGGDVSAGVYQSASDLGSERQKTMHIESVPFHGLRSHVSGQQMANGIVGSKRSNSHSAYEGQDGFDRLHSVKTYRGGSAGEQSRRLNREEIIYGSRALRPTSLSQALPHQTHNNTDGCSAKWDRSVTVNAQQNVHYPSYASPFVHQVPSNTFRDDAVGSSVLSHIVADEGSMNGIKGSGVRNSMTSSFASDEIRPSGGDASELSGPLVTRWKLISGAHLPETDAPVPGNRRSKSSSSSRQMTIFYDGHAHVFDDVHPNKADVIMALAGSWSSTFSEKSSRKLDKESSAPTGETQDGSARNTDLAGDQRGKPSSAVKPIPELRSSGQTSTVAGRFEHSPTIK